MKPGLLALALLAAACGGDDEVLPADAPPTFDAPPTIDAPPAVDASADAPGGILPLGHPCTLGADCASGSCVDDVCCESACDGTCEACDGVLTGGSGGSCLP